MRPPAAPSRPNPPLKGTEGALGEALRESVAANRDAGVSLLEMLAALAIIAVMATTVVVLGDFGGDPEEQAGERLMRALAEAEREALLSGEFVGFSADADARGYRFFRRGDEIWLERRDHPALEPVRFSDDGLSLTLVEGGVPARAASGLGEARETRPPAPQIWFDPAGFDEPFTYRLDGPRGGAILMRTDDGGLKFEHRPAEGGA